ncbi:MAG: DUF202 domain-containing protein [Gammaproteobacteria bacterium]
MNAAQQTVSIPPVKDFKPDAPILIDVPPGSTSESECSKRRTALSGHRTGLSIERTDLSQQRTSLSTLRSHLSNERTHLSYIRTAVSLVGFGITLNRFAIYLIQSDRLGAGVSRSAALQETKSVGLGMVILGFALLIWAVFRFHRTSRDIELRRYHTGWRAVLIASSLFLVLGAAATLWLFTM